MDWTTAGCLFALTAANSGLQKSQGEKRKCSEKTWRVVSETDGAHAMCCVAAASINIAVGAMSAWPRMDAYFWRSKT